MAGRPLALPHPDWLYHELTVSGDERALHDFRESATGAGVVPWVLDYDRLEEDWFHLLLTPASQSRLISLPGARILARQLRDAVWERHEAAVSLVGVGRGCPFDLHGLAPVPHAILRLGPDDPDARAWAMGKLGHDLESAPRPLAASARPASHLSLRFLDSRLDALARPARHPGAAPRSDARSLRGLRD